MKSSVLLLNVLAGKDPLPLRELTLPSLESMNDV